ncbi:hypothetical protein C5Y96_01640 [Blastopirellula marina]|uniref:Uncharacterized protein n=1 Tax=Blastopirellula marina TaxID=124 RepID=A0A2S8G7R6_9BACT|nr:hypothetical protein C5Y96_01640 [Blastopirellula marina]RCS55849.1 hypothetical protein DTL36_01640 [Bremerella cremea]
MLQSQLAVLQNLPAALLSQPAVLQNQSFAVVVTAVAPRVLQNQPVLLLKPHLLLQPKLPLRKKLHQLLQQLKQPKLA